MRFYRSFNSLTMTASRIAASKVQRTDHRNNFNSQIISSSAAMRAFASKLTLFILLQGRRKLFVVTAPLSHPVTSSVSGDQTKDAFRFNPFCFAFSPYRPSSRNGRLHLGGSHRRVRQRYAFLFTRLTLFSTFSTGPGEFVEADEIVARIETDKVTVDITTPVSGVIK